MYKEKSLNKLCNQQLKQMYKEKGDKRGILESGNMIYA